MIKKKLEDIYEETPRAGNAMSDYLKQFLEILMSTNSGLTFSLGEFDIESSSPDIEWDIRSLQSTDSNLKTGCN